MADISKPRAGDEIEILIKAKVVGDGSVMTTSGRHPRWFGDEFFSEIAESITLVHPEIVPGLPYVDDEGKLYVGRSKGWVIHYNGNLPQWFFTEGSNPLPAGLRPAKVVPEP